MNIEISFLPSCLSALVIFLPPISRPFFGGGLIYWVCRRRERGNRSHDALRGVAEEGKTKRGFTAAMAMADGKARETRAEKGEKEEQRVQSFCFFANWR